MKQWKGKSYHYWDAQFQWNHKQDWLAAADKYGFEYITEWLIDEVVIKKNSRRTVAQKAGVHRRTLGQIFLRMGVDSPPSGGANNRNNAKGLFFFKPDFPGPRRYFVAGYVQPLKKGGYRYKVLRCTRCNEILSHGGWLTHAECFKLIREHLKGGDCR